MEPSVNANIFQLRYSSIGQHCLDNLKKGCHLVAFVNADRGEETRYNELLQKSVDLANSLRRLGVKKSDTISLVSGNQIEFAIVLWATWFVGAIFTPISSLCSVDEIKYNIHMTRPTHIFTIASKETDVVEAMKIMGDLRPLYVFNSPAPKYGVQFSSLIGRNDDVDSFRTTPVAPDDIALILYSSGTTGLPKGVLITNNTLLQYPPYLRSQFSSIFNNPNACLLGVLPFGHIMGFCMILSMTTMNIKTVILEQFHIKKLLPLLEKHKVTHAFVVPTLLVYLAKAPEVLKYDITSLRYIYTGGTKSSAGILDQVNKRLNLSVRELYGSTEAGASIGNPEFGTSKANSIGLRTSGMLIKISDPETEKTLGPNMAGELRFKGPMVMKAYLGPEEIISGAFDSEGFFKSGDLGYFDEDGYYFIVGRLKELIKYNGYQVSPAELENVLMEHNSVSEAGVVGIPDLTAGEIPMAFVVKVPGANVTDKEIMEHVSAKVAPYKRLRGGVIFVDSIPKNKTGKLLRKELSNMLKKLTFSKF